MELHGPNVLYLKPSTKWFVILGGQLRSAFVALLVVATGLAWLLGDAAESAAILAVLTLTVAFGFITELRARRAVDALRALQVQRTTVVRDGKLAEIDARELVPGDIINLEAGYSIPADARIIRASELRAAEAELTGESTAVVKDSDDVLPARTPLPDRRNMVYLGTSVVAGTGRAVVTATGTSTEVGKIGVMVTQVPFERTAMERRLDMLGRQLGFLALGVGALVAAIAVLRGVDLNTVIRTGIAVAIAAVPEGLPAVVTIAMAIGVHRMARRHAIVRRLPTIESIGSTTVVCTDKTGTLTQGDMCVTRLAIGSRDIRVGEHGTPRQGQLLESGVPVEASDPDVAAALRIASLANRAEATKTAGDWEVVGDPTDAALLSLAANAGVDRDALLQQWPEIGDLPFSSERMMMATWHRSPDGRIVAKVKGSPVNILALCDKVVSSHGTVPLDDSGRGAVLSRNDELASAGLRVLALAQGVVADAGENDLRGLTLVGLAGMVDSAAPGVDETIRLLRDAGIRTVMLTGDQRRTAEAVAVNLGIIDADGAIALDGADVDAMTATELAQRVRQVAAFSRVSPEAKLRIVTAFQDQGEIVAMLGDGVNDAPALRKSDVGVAMGRHGTDAAREAADVVLSDDRFSTVGSAVEEGRVIFDNVQKFTFYLFSCNLAEILVLLGAGLFALPLPLLPLQILWLNLVTDTFPAFVLAFEPADVDVMRRPPRDPRTAILSRRMLQRVFGYSTLIALCVLAAFLLGLREVPGDVRYAVTMAFMTLAFGQLFHLGNARSRAAVISPRRALANPLAIGAVALVIALQVLAVKLQPLADLLDIVPLSPAGWAAVVGFGLVPGIAGQAIKLLAARDKALVSASGAAVSGRNSHA